MVHVHLADEAVLVHALALDTLGVLGPHLLDVLENHVEVAIKSLDTRQQLAVVAAGDQDLGVGARGGQQERQGAGAELMRLDERDLIFTIKMQDVKLVLCAVCTLRSLHEDVKKSVAKFPRRGRRRRTPQARESETPDQETIDNSG